MCFFFRISCFLVVNLLLVDARPQGLFQVDSSDSLWNDQLNDPWDDPVTDPASNNLFLDSNEYTSDGIDLALNPVEEDSTTDGDSNTSTDWDNLFASTTPPDLSALPNCESQGSLTDGLLQARDGEVCAPKKQEGTINLPTELFQDPAGYLQREFQKPPLGQTDQPDKSTSNDEELNFGSFLQNRPAALTFKEDSDRCPSRNFGLSNTPVCDNPHTGDAVQEPGQTGFTLYNVAPFIFRSVVCVAPSSLWCCREIVTRPSGFSLANLGDISRDSLQAEQLDYLTRYMSSIADAHHCYPQKQGIASGNRVDIHGW